MKLLYGLFSVGFLRSMGNLGSDEVTSLHYLIPFCFLNYYLH